MKAYMVSSGAYSDYSVEAVFTTRERAEYAKLMWHSDGVEEIDLDPEVLDPPHLGLLPYRVEMDKLGRTDQGGVSRCSSDGMDKSIPQPQYFDSRNRYIFHVWARDPEHAVKITNEKRLQLIAENQWIPWEVHREQVLKKSKETECQSTTPS